MVFPFVKANFFSVRAVPLIHAPWIVNNPLMTSLGIGATCGAANAIPASRQTARASSKLDRL